MRETIDFLQKKLSAEKISSGDDFFINELEKTIDILDKYHQSLILENGAWNLKNSSDHVFDIPLSNSLLNLLKFKGISDCLDLGCGDGRYTDFFNNNKMPTKGYDGNPNTPLLTNDKCGVLDLSKPFTLEKKFDCVMSLEVGEHIPEKYEQTFIDNVANHANKLVVISWAIPNQGGYGHVNCKDNGYIREQFFKRGYVAEMYLENIIRFTAEHTWFKNTILIFSK